jgi:hypothetical protein
MNERKLPSWIQENVLCVSPELAKTTLFKFNVKLQVKEYGEDGKAHNKVLTVDLLPDLDLDYEILEQQIQDIPSQYAFWSTVFSEVKMGVAIAERQYKMRLGEAMEEITDRYAQNGLKPTAEVIKRIVEKDTELVKADLELQKAHMKAGKLYHMLEALKLKAELARTLAGFKKNEGFHN